MVADKYLDILTPTFRLQRNISSSAVQVEPEVNSRGVLSFLTHYDEQYGDLIKYFKENKNMKSHIEKNIE